MDDDAFVDEEMEPDAELNRMTNEIIAAAIEVHRTLGVGHLESTYETALAIEFDLRGIPYQRQLEIAVDYKGRAVGKSRLDFLVFGTIVLELKTVEAVAPIHRAIVTSYLKITRKKLALILNFHVRALKDGIRRIAL